VKPFVDHVFCFSVLDGRIWFRNYQVAVPAPLGKLDKAAMEKMTLVEVSPSAESAFHTWRK
jgi:ribosome biogenesis protein BRX1